LRSSRLFDSKGERVVTASADETARIWDARTGEPIGKPLQHGSSVEAAAFDPKGERVITASDDKTARIWRAPPTGQALVEEIRATLGRNAPEPLKLPRNAARQEDYSTLMALGLQTLFARAQSLFQPN
jgi:WD40 repeat protein